VNPISEISDCSLGHRHGLPRANDIVRPGAALSLRNQTRNSVLADELVVANTFLPRLVGLLAKTAEWSRARRGLWIIPSRGVHTWGMRFPIDVVFLDRHRKVLHIESNLRPWRISKVVVGARSVVELPASTVANTRTCVGDQIEVISA